MDNYKANLPNVILRTAHQIHQLKQQIEVAPNDKHLQHQLQIIQLWQLSQAEKGERL